MPGAACGAATVLHAPDPPERPPAGLNELRSSFASRALALGETLPVIGKLLGHSDIEPTARYAHLAQDSIHETAERIAESTAGDIMQIRHTPPLAYYEALGLQRRHMGTSRGRRLVLLS